MSDSKTLPPEFAATAGDLMAYRARERFNLFELACLLHRADPERVHNDTWNGWRDRKLQIGFDRAELTPALFIGELDLMPELLAGPLIGGTIKQLKKAIGCATIMHSIGADQARTLADSLGLAFPPELSAAQPPQPAPQAEVTAGGPSGGKVWTDERKAEVRAYREKHGLKKTAEHYGVSQATISKHVPANKVKPPGYSAFTYRSK